MDGKRAQTNRQQSIITLVVLGLVLIFYLFFGRNGCHKQPIDHREKAFRHNNISYTKHARCRMDCRHINEKEVKEILDKGEINYRKSEIQTTPCPKYALEGMTEENQHVRLIVGDCENEAVIITVIDLDHEFECQCE